MLQLLHFALRLLLVEHNKDDEEFSKVDKWVKPWIANREAERSFHKLMKELEQDPEHYKNYTRMDLPTFKELASTEEM